MRGYVQFNKYTHTHTHTLPPREDQCEWHRMTRMTGPDCVVMCNLINTHTHLINTHTHTHTHTHTEDQCESHRMTRMTGPDCAVMCNLINYTHTHTNRVDSGSFSSRCCAFRRTHTSADSIRAGFTVGGTPYALWLVGNFACDCIFWENSGRGLYYATGGHSNHDDSNERKSCGLGRSGVQTRAQTLFGYFVPD